MKRCFTWNCRQGVSALLALTLLALFGCSNGGGDKGDGSSNGDDGLYTPTASQAVIYYKREDNNYEGWGLHLWNASGAAFSPGDYISGGETSWAKPLPATGVSTKYGAYYVVDFDSAAWSSFNLIMHNGDDKDLGGQDHTYTKATLGDDAFSFSGVAVLYPDPLESPPVALEGAKAHWLDANLIAYNGSGSVRLYHSASAAITVNATTGELSGGDAIELTSASLSDQVKARFPHLASYSAWALPDSADAKALLKEQLIVAQFSAGGELRGATQVQTRGALDALYADAAADAQLGAVTAGNTTYKLWAPTAQSVKVKRYDADKNLLSADAMAADPSSGVWTFASDQNDNGRYYRYEVKVYHYQTGAVETFDVTDPYSLSLSTNSEYSQVADLSDVALQPGDWSADADTSAYAVSAPEDIIIYETHVRDFSGADKNGTAAYNGKFLAYTEPGRESMTHLQALKDAGLTHVHLLPVFDIATVDERSGSRADLDSTKAEFCALNSAATLCGDGTVADSATLRSVLEACDPATGCAQALMNDLRALDSFNWGYDPYHYTAPEGGYANDPEGTSRILEFRRMVKALHDMGLNVVMDVVYNHTNAAGAAEKSVLDKIVPGYYQRLNPESGAVENSTCCSNTATEAAMFQKLMEDSLVVWARDYHIDSFRFDLMGHHPKAGIESALAKVRAVRSNVYFYGEGWNFGEVQNDARFVQATQLNLGGSQIGTFTDRLRDAVRGGGPFDSADSLRANQGFANGLYNLPNELNSGSEAEKSSLLHLSDNIRVGMAGNLTDFVLVDASGATNVGSNLDYNGQPTAYAKDPADTINYVSKHDNQTLWDNNQYKAASDVNAQDRARMQMLALSIPLLSQGVPFLHMGSDILRSKSMQRDSYDSGDWFNKVDFSYTDNNWNVGLPREDKDGANWPLIQNVIANVNAQASTAQITDAAAVFRDFLRVRSGSKLFRLENAADIKARVDFHNVGASQIPGLIAMSIDDGAGLTDLDPNHDAIVVIINASGAQQTIAVPGASGFQLIDAQASGADPVAASATSSGDSFTVPALTSAVFVKPQGASQGTGLPVNYDNKDPSAIPPYGPTTLYLRGDMNGWGTETPLTFSSNGDYVATLTLAAGSYGLKIADADWAAINFGGGLTLTPGETAALTAGGDNLSLTLTEESQVTFRFNASDKDATTLTLTTATVAEMK
ncbi:pullulanase-type alpha-1,6-glucosidase [Hahella sp. NBU794]|uniref:pullulanase-type alpha-1,6-glucosidase n=1 Tax=Hahella sp. NBU794 TaxID=3422590 RepID=UPI003D6FFAD8